ncbi:hypothetical protein PCE1_002915 [Barthelona sp. PCE]
MNPSDNLSTTSTYVPTLQEACLIQGGEIVTLLPTDHDFAPIILCSPSSRYIAEPIAQQLGLPITKLVLKEFRDRERYYRIGLDDRKSLIGRDAILITATATDEDLLLLFRVGCELAALGTRRRLFIVPFLGYSTMERSVRPCECVTCASNIIMMSSIPNTGLGNIFLFLDLHVSSILNYFQETTAFELYGEGVLLRAVESLNLEPESFMFGSADLGRPSWVQTFANKFNTDLAFIRKVRTMENTKVMNVIGDVEGKVVIIYDDMIRSGGTICKAADAYLSAGAKAVYALTTHLAIPDEDTIIALNASNIELILGTNSHPNSMSWYVRECPKIKVFDVSHVFVDHIRRSCIMSNPKMFLADTPMIDPTISVESVQ